MGKRGRPQRDHRKTTERTACKDPMLSCCVRSTAAEQKLGFSREWTQSSHLVFIWWISFSIQGPWRDATKTMLHDPVGIHVTHGQKRETTERPQEDPREIEAQVMTQNRQPCNGDCVSRRTGRPQRDRIRIPEESARDHRETTERPQSDFRRERERPQRDH